MAKNIPRNKTAWIGKDQRYPEYIVSLSETSDLTSVKVELTPQQVRLVKRYEKTQQEFDAMCEQLLKEHNVKRR